LQRIVTHSADETVEAGHKLAESLVPGDVVAFFGGLGMGKTAFISGIAKGLCVTDHVSSPTFALVHEYRGKLPLYHFDMYRVSSWDDLYSTGFFDYLEVGGICAVEWSENIEEALPENAVRVNISRGDGKEEDDNTRVITIIKGKCGNENTRG
jgi:tRNA threonylcarbamoyladenosine biosynthesis protein TsaE